MLLQLNTEIPCVYCITIQIKRIKPLNQNELSILVLKNALYKRNLLVQGCLEKQASGVNNTTNLDSSDETAKTDFKTD